MANLKKTLVDSVIKTIIENMVYETKVKATGSYTYVVLDRHETLATFMIYRQRSVLYLNVLSTYPRKCEQIGKALLRIEERLKSLRQGVKNEEDEDE